MLIVYMNSKIDQTNSWKKNLLRAINYKAQEIPNGGEKVCCYSFPVYTHFPIQLLLSLI